MYIKELYFHIKGTPLADEYVDDGTKNYVKVVLYYRKEDTSYYPRGFYTRLMPIGWDGKVESYELFSETGKASSPVLLKTCTRRTKKAEAEAVAFFEEKLPVMLRENYGDRVEM